MLDKLVKNIRQSGMGHFWVRKKVFWYRLLNLFYPQSFSRSNSPALISASDGFAPGTYTGCLLSPITTIPWNFSFFMFAACNEKDFFKCSYIKKPRSHSCSLQIHILLSFPLIIPPAQECRVGLCRPWWAPSRAQRQAEHSCRMWPGTARSRRLREAPLLNTSMCYDFFSRFRIRSDIFYR